MQKISIIKMKKEDVDAVFEIEKLVHPNHHWSKDSFYNEISNNLAHYYCAKNEDGNILEYLGVCHIFEEAHIKTLAVQKELLKSKTERMYETVMTPNQYKQHLAQQMQIENAFSDFLRK